MTPAFGFSVGDFVSAIQLIRKICKALQTVGGASTHYQRVLIELNGLSNVLLELERIEPTEDDAGQINTLRAMLHACQLLLHDFLAKLEKYQESLTPFSRSSTLQAAGRKTQWAVKMERETEKVRACVVANVVYINAFLQGHTYHASRRREVRRQTDHEQLLSLVHDEAERVRVAVHQHIPATPTALLVSNIRFTDALDRYKELPYDYFRNWDIFETFLKGEFGNAPGRRQVMAGRYAIADTRNPGKVVTKHNWSQVVFPGAEVTMSIILSMLRLQIGRCPRPSCGQASTFDGASASLVECTKCGLKYYPPTTDLKDAMGNLQLKDEAESVLQRQAVEDLNAFGMRPAPRDATELGPVHPDSPSQTPKRGIDHPDTTGVLLDSENLKRLDEAEDEVKTSFPASGALSIIDWHSGPTPIESWLNQSAIRMDSGILHEVGDEKLQEKEILDQEQRDIEILRKVHLSAEPATPDTGLLEGDGYEGLDEVAKPFLRKILDKFPLIQPFLARRLAESSLSRDTRLRKSRDEAERKRQLDSRPRKGRPSEDQRVDEDDYDRGDRIAFLDGTIRVRPEKASSPSSRQRGERERERPLRPISFGW